ncbi:MAG: S8 family serine peptidase [Deltaproteobacteria bacterium]|nr:S8 family serine peptidase [Deltaproteobacteria bacterium]
MGGEGKSSPSKFSIGIGGLLKLGKVAVGVGAGSVGIGVGKGSVGVDAGPFGISIGGDAADQWGLRAVGFTPLDDPASAWRLEDGTKKNVIVAIIDSGLDMEHPDGPQYVWINPGEVPGNGIDDDENVFIDDVNGWNFVYENNDLTDDNGHGTFVSGIIAANTNNGIGIAGINPGAQIMVLKVVNRDGRCESLNIFRALRYAANHGAKIINISLGAEGMSRLEQLGVNYAHYRGAVVVVAAGNQASDITKHSPAGLRKVFSVSATKMEGKLKQGSNFGPTVALAAPGENIFSLTSKDGKHDGMITPIATTEYHQLSGTSFAAPFVAGVASLMLAKTPELTNFEIEEILLATARDIDAEGWDIYTGAGILDAKGALTQSTEKALVARITEILINREKEDFVSADVYGTVQGDFESYIVEVGRGKNPKKWEKVYGPSKEIVSDGHICRIEKDTMEREGDWVVRIKTHDRSGRERLVNIPIFTGTQSSVTLEEL